MTCPKDADTKPKALDLFCGAGGACAGLQAAGFDVTGVDIIPQPDYPGRFIQADALAFDCVGYDFIWASPPCQGYIPGRKDAQAKHPKLIPQVREKLEATGIPFVLENVPGAPLRKDLMLCGQMFGLPLIRHRVFELHGFTVPQPEHKKHQGKVTEGTLVYVYGGGRPGCFGNNEKRNKIPKWTLAQKQAAMGITHINDERGLCEAIPPAYAEYIGKCLAIWGDEK